MLVTHNTEAGNNWVGYTIDHAPAPMLMVLPTLEMAKRSSRQRLGPMIEENPTLSAKINTKKQKDSDNTILMKEFPNGVIVLAGGNSPAGLRSMAAKKLFLDEIDEYTHDAGGQGDPVKLAEARARTFGNKRKVFKVSTPTIAGVSRIERAFHESDQRYFHIPCPSCEEFQTLTFENLKWPTGEPHKAVYSCEHCGYEMKDYEKTKFLKKGKWIAENPGAKQGLIAGFHLNSLYSPTGWLSWAEIATEWTELQQDKSKERLKAFVNTVLGETWKEKSDAPDWNRLYERREKYKLDIVPRGAAFLTCGVDVQKDRLEAEVIAWGRRKENWSITHRVFLGDTSKDDVWNKLDDLLAETFPRAEDERLRLPIKMTCVDSGYLTQTVYAWARKYSSTKLSVIKGRDSMTTPVGLPKAVDVTIRGKTVRRGLKLWTLGVSILKHEVYSYLRQNAPVDDEPTPIGYSHFPEYDSEYFQQLTAEEVVIKVVKGYKKQEWQKTRDRNEALDLRVYNLAAAIIVGIDRFKPKHWEKLEGATVISKPSPKTSNASEKIETVVPKTKAKIKRRLSNWL